MKEEISKLSRLNSYLPSRFEIKHIEIGTDTDDL